MRIIVIAAWFALCAPLFAQRAEVYGLGGYSRRTQTDRRLLLRLKDPNGGFFGGGIGIRAIGILGIEGEFFQARLASERISYFNTGALNIVLEKRTGRVRPGGIVMGLGLAQGANSQGYLFGQFGGGAAVMLTDRLYVRPQVRWQGWAQIFGDDLTCVSVAVALGYRF